MNSHKNRVKLSVLKTSSVVSHRKKEKNEQLVSFLADAKVEFTSEDKKSQHMCTIFEPARFLLSPSVKHSRGAKCGECVMPCMGDREGEKMKQVGKITLAQAPLDDSQPAIQILF